jgi:hypothetical protein
MSVALLKPDPMSDTDEIRGYRFSFRRVSPAGLGLLALLALRAVPGPVARAGG